MNRTLSRRESQRQPGPRRAVWSRCVMWSVRSVLLGIALVLGGCRREELPAPGRVGRRADASARDALVGESAACDVPLSRPTSAIGNALVANDDGSLVAAVDADADAVVIVTRRAGALAVLRRIPVGARPVQVLFAANALWVVERGEGALSAYDVATGRRLCHRSIARDPVSLARSVDGRSIFVAATSPPSLVGVDARSGASRFDAAVPPSPRGLWVAPSGDRVIVSHLAGPTLSAVDLHGDTAAPRSLSPPPFERHRRYSGGESNASFVFRPSPSQAWGIVYEPASGRLLVPLMANNHRVDVRDTFVGSIANGYGGGSRGGDSLDQQMRFTVGVFDPATERWERLVSSDAPNEPEDAHPGAYDLRGTVGSAWSNTDGLLVLAQGNDTVAVVRPGRPPRWEARASVRQRSTLHAPDALLVMPDGEVLVHSLVDHAIEYGPQSARARLVFGEERLDPQVARGRRLFLMASSRIALDRLNCNACHPDGGDDGLEWDLLDRHLRTPALVGRARVVDGGPGARAALVAAIRVELRRLRGTGLPDDDIAALAAYLDRGSSAR